MNNKYKVLLPQQLHPAVMDSLRNEFTLIEGIDDLEEKIKYADAAIVRTAKIDKSLINESTKLRIIIRCGVGIDNIDVDASSEKLILVSNTPGVYTIPVAEYIIMSMIFLAKRLSIIVPSFVNGNFGIRTTMGYEVTGKTLGILGLGKIGKTVADICMKSFNMNVIAYDPYVNKEDVVFTLVDDLVDLIPKADFLVLALPSTKETKGLIGQKELELAKKNLIIINAARSNIIDESSLLTALQQGTIAGAAIDVFPEEPPDFKSPIFKLSNVLLTPHIAGLTDEGFLRASTCAINELKKALEGDIPSNLANAHILQQWRKKWH